MGSPPLGPKPKSLPHRLINGSSPLHVPASVTPKERQRLVASIESSQKDRQPIDFNDQSAEPALHAPVNGDVDHEKSPSAATRSRVPSRLSEEPRDPRDETSMASALSNATRPASPYTLNPPIDFDGLSWPSESSAGPVLSSAWPKQEHQASVPASGSKPLPKRHRRGWKSWKAL